MDNLRLSELSTTEIAEYLREKRNTAFILWQVQDVYDVAKKIDVEIDDAVAEKVIARLNSTSDANYGITWDTLEAAIEVVAEEQEDEMPFTFWTIQKTVGWDRFCDVTGGNHYALNEGLRPNDNEIFWVKESHAKELGFI